MKWYVSPDLAKQEKERLVAALERMARIADSPHYYPLRTAVARMKVAEFRGDTEEEAKQAELVDSLTTLHKNWLEEHNES